MYYYETGTEVSEVWESPGYLFKGNLGRILSVNYTLLQNASQNLAMVEKFMGKIFALFSKMPNSKPISPIDSARSYQLATPASLQ